MMWIIRKYLDRYRAWRRAREDYVIAQAMLLGADIHPWISNNDARYHNAARGLPTIYYRALLPCTARWAMLPCMVKLSTNAPSDGWIRRS